MPGLQGNALPPPPKRSSLKRRNSEDYSDKSSDGSGEMKRNISFHNIEIREYGVTIGDNPSCRYGCPVGLSWDVESEKKMNLDTYELNRERRPKKDMVLSHFVRMKLLAGCRRTDVYEAIEQVKKIQNQRKRTKNMLSIQPLEEVLETLFHRSGSRNRKK